MPQYQIINIKDLQDNLSKIASQLTENNIIVEVRRYSDTVGYFIPHKFRQMISDYLEEEEMKADHELVKSCLEGRREIRAGKGIPLEQTLKRIDKNYAHKKI